MSAATPMQVRQWSDEVAADPASLAFLPLAGAYREQGRHDAALKLCIRGLEKHPDHVEAHYLLGLLYREGGEQLKAFDEWDIALALDPDHAASRREIGLIAYTRGDHSVAVRHLEKSLANDAFDQEVRDALEDAWAKSKGGGASPASARPAPPPPVVPAAPVRTATAPAAAASPSTVSAVPAAAVATPAAGAADGTHFDAVAGEFDALAAERGIVGAVLLDDQGFVLAGQMVVGGVDRGPEVAAVLSGASSEAGRALTHLGLGAWKGILVETPEAVVRLAPAGDGMIAVAGRREVPTGWTLRVAVRARDAALRFLGAGGGA
ncbi:tetratricopeptide repeat protein [Longimicrobium sp.]|uniref:roadblock/LC7 domain-containing protein n=1 Tax=Longimicrobium sp. TaxID=2029185 RepID=UPI003B3BD5F1